MPWDIVLEGSSSYLMVRYFLLLSLYKLIISFQIIGRHLRQEKARNKNTAISLLDCALRGVTVLSSAAVSELTGVELHGLVISSGDIRRVQQGAFNSVSPTLIALG